MNLVYLLCISFVVIIKYAEEVQGSGDDCQAGALVSVRVLSEEESDDEKNKTKSKPEEEFKHISSGILIKKNWVVTSAEHLVEVPVKDMRVAAVKEMGLENVNAFKGFVYKVAGKIIHFDYDNISLLNNIALIKLQDPVTHIALAHIPEEELETGLEENCSEGKFLRWVAEGDDYKLDCEKVEFLVFSSCKEKHEKSEIHALSESEHDCVSIEGAELWAGESGAPVVCQNMYYAIASFQDGADSPVVFTRLDKHQLDFLAPAFEEDEMIFKINGAGREEMQFFSLSFCILLILADIF